MAASFSGEESVLSISRRYGVAASAIYGWRKIYGDRDTGAADGAEPPAFVPICVEDAPAAEQDFVSPPAEGVDYRITVSYGADREIAVSGAFEIGDLVRFVRGVAV